MTLNPISHLDPIGAISLLVFRFGWAKPVPINPYYFKNRKRDTAITSIAGPISNFLTAFVSIFFMGLIIKYHIFQSISGVLNQFLYLLCIINIGLGVFNLIPVPPLDGSKILNSLLPEKVYFSIMRYESYGNLILILLLFTGLLNTPLNFLREGIFNSAAYLVTAILGI